MQRFRFPESDASGNVPSSLSSSAASPRAPSAYMSTYNKEYLGYDGPPAPNARVQTSQFYPSVRPGIASTYQAEYLNFPANKRTSVPYGTSSGYRKNNPHPHNMVAAFKHPNRDYFVWSQYQRLPPLPQGFDPSMNSKTLLNQVCQDKIRSIYQQDFHEPPYATDPTRPSTQVSSRMAPR